jgi:hypothetical protein
VLQESWAADTVVSAVHQLPRLLELHVRGSKCTEAGFAALPATLTTLVIAGDSDLVCSPSTTPGLTQLTALQWLGVDSVARFDLAALVNSKQLQHLKLRDLKLSNDPAAGQGPQLCVLQHLTRLQHLDLPTHEESPDSLAGATAQDFAALTASSQLTYLDISIIVELEHKWGYRHMFREGGLLISKPVAATKKRVTLYFSSQQICPAALCPCHACACRTACRPAAAAPAQAGCFHVPAGESMGLAWPH